MTALVQTYLNDLLFALRMRGVPGDRIAEALAEVQSHTAETGEDPQGAFGPPKAYADQLAAVLGKAERPAPFWRSVLTWSTAAYGLAGALGGWLLLAGVDALSADRRGPLGLPGVGAVVAGLAVLAALMVALRRLARHDQTEVRDPRTGVDMTPPLPRWALPVMLSAPVLTLLIAAVLAFLN